MTPPGVYRAGMPLSPREREVAGLIAVGKKTSEIAVLLGIGEKTVSTHRERIRQKIGIRNNVELTLWWQRNHHG